MSVEYRPGIGDWYRNSNGDSFEIVAVDDEDQTVELQYFDGTVEELEFETWSQLRLEPIEPPEDWSGSLDIEREDYGVDLDQSLHVGHANPLDQLDQLDEDH